MFIINIFYGSKTLIYSFLNTGVNSNNLLMHRNADLSEDAERNLSV